MSARQAFVPTGRAAPSLNAPDNYADKSPGDTDPAPPLAQPQTFKKDLMQKSQTEPLAKSLNISGLIPKNKTVQALKVRHSKTTEGRPQTPANAWTGNTHSPQIAAPKPGHTSTATGLFTVATFGTEKTFPRTSPEPMQSNDIYGIPGYDQTPPPLLPPVSHSSLNKHRMSHQLEKITEALEEYEEGEASEYGSLHASRHTSGQRRNQRIQSLPQVPNGSQEGTFEGHILRRTSKKRSNDADEETDYGYAIKKFRAEEEPVRRLHFRNSEGSRCHLERVW
jgi:hypothetical protein